MQTSESGRLIKSKSTKEKFYGNVTRIIGQFKVKELILLCVCGLFKNFITKCRKRNVRQTKGTINCIPGQGE